jgi:arylsulfatase A-like enzyme/Flp pilus assembly protein TadD
VALALLVLGLGCNRIEVDPRPPRATGPNLLLVTIDTLRADRVEAYGAADAVTPTLDRLASEGVRFETAISAAPVTLPSHASILTGLYPPHHGARYNGLFELPSSAQTLTERLLDAGYATGAVIGAVVVAEPFGLAQGFQFYDDEDFWDQRSAPGGYLERPAAEVTDRAIRWLEGVEGPFFLWVHYFDPHATYRPPPPYDRTFAERPYDGEVAYVDAELGRLIAKLETSGQLENTLVVATSDHGESLGEHGESTHSYTLYDAALRVPLVLRGPGLPAGSVVEPLVRTVDIAPTLLALLNLPGLPGVDGRDLTPLWHDSEALPPLVAYAETFAPRYDHGWSPLFAARSDEHLYVRAPRSELYEVVRDPGQVRNLLEAETGELRATAEVLDEALAPLAALEPGGPSRHLDAATREKLHALGYAIADGPIAPTETDPKDGLLALHDYQVALEAFDAQDLDRAEAALERALEQLSHSPSARALLGRVYLIRGQYERALPHLELAARQVPRSGLYPSLIGDAKAGLGDLAGALEQYEQAIQLNPNMAPAHVGLMWRVAVGGSLEDAEAHARRAAELMPQSADLHVRIATIWAALRQPERALPVLEKALQIDPGSQRVQMELAIQLTRLGKATQAETHLAQAGALRSDPLLRNRLAVAHADAGSAERAELIFRELVQGFPEYPSPRRNLALLLRRSGRAPEAQALEGATPIRAGDRP